MTTERTDEADRRRRWVAATCAALVLAAVGDAGPEIIGSRSLVAGYDGPGPLICLGVALIVAVARWRFAPLLAVAMAVLFLVGGFADADFVGRLTGQPGVGFVAGWLQMLGFAAAVVCGTAAVRRREAAQQRSES
jgi:hypothetical protein